MPKDIDPKKVELAKTTVMRGLMHREFINKVKGKGPPPDTPLGHGNTDIYLKAIMGNKFNEYNTPEEKVDAFDLIYMQLSLAISEPQRLAFSAMLSEEARHPDQSVFYHGTETSIGFMYDLITEFRKQLEMQYSDDVQILRPFDDPFTLYKDVTQFRKSMEVGGTDAYNELYQQSGMSVNPFLFGSDGYPSEATYALFLSNTAQHAPKTKELFDYFMQRLKLDVDFSLFEKIFHQYVEKTGGVLYQIFVDNQVVDEVATPAGPNAYHNPLITDQGVFDRFSDVILTLKDNPEKYVDYIKKLQTRLYLNPEILHDPSKVQIKIYRANPLSSDQEINYKNSLRKAVTECVIQLLAEHRKLPSTAFARAKGKPSLHRQMEMVFQQNELHEPDDQDIKLMIPDLIAKNDLKTLVKFMVKTEDLNLSRLCDYGKGVMLPPSLLSLFKGEISVRVYEALQPYKEKRHIAMALQELQEMVFYHYISIGDLPKAEEFFGKELNRDPQYLDAMELQILKEWPGFYANHILEKGIKIAVESHQSQAHAWLLEKLEERSPQALKKQYEQKAVNDSDDPYEKILYNAAKSNQVEIFSAALERCRGTSGALDNIHQYFGNGCLNVAIKNGNHEIISLIFSMTDRDKLTSNYFVNILYKRDVYAHPDVARVIFDNLAKVKNSELWMKEIFIKSYSPLFFLVEKGYDSLLDQVLSKYVGICPYIDTLRSHDGYRSLLYIAIAKHNANIVKILLNHATNPSQFIRNFSWMHPLLLAARQNDLLIVKLLLEHMTYFDEHNQYGKTALMVAAELGYTDVVKAIICHPAVCDNITYLNAKTIEHQLDALGLAAKRGHLETVKLLLTDSHLSAHLLETFDIKMAFDQASKNGHTDICTFISQTFPNIDMPGPHSTNKLK